MKPLRFSFRTRLAFWYTLLLAVTVLILGLVIVAVSQVSILSTIDGVLEEAGRAVLSVVRIESGADETSADHLILESNAPLNTPGVWIQIWQNADSKGANETPHLLEFSDGMSEVGQPLNPDTITSHEPGLSSLTFNDQALRVLTIPLFNGDRPFGVIQVATSVLYFEQMHASLPPIIILAAVVAIFISLLMSVTLADRAVRPIEKVTKAASSIVDARDLSIRLTEEDADEELGQLIRMFNRMMERLEHVFNVQQRLVNDVSHEMRTPLTSIIGHIEIMQRYGVDRESLQSIHQEADRLSRTVNELLLLVRADSGEIAVDMGSVDLDALVLENYEQAHYLVKGRDLKLVLEGLDPVRVRGNRERLHQLVQNLVTNAIKFTPDHGTIRLSLKNMGSEAILSVSDTGIGISPEDQQRIFDRFFQADPSRTHHRENDGSGLGLSIAKWVVDIHRGQIVVESELGKGSTFRVTLPALPPSPKSRHDTEDEWPALSRKS